MSTVENTDSGVGSGATASASITSVTSGNDLIICVSGLYSTGGGAPDSGDITLGGTATYGTIEEIAGASILETAFAADMAAAVMRVPITGTGSCDVDYDQASGLRKQGVWILEVSGLDSASAEDSTEDSSTSNDTSPNAGSMTSAGDAIFVGVCATYDGNTVTAGTGYTGINTEQVGNPGPVFTSDAQYETVTGPTTQDCDWTASSNSGAVMCGAVFADESVGGGTSYPQGLHGIAHGINVQRSTRLGGELEH